MKFAKLSLCGGVPLLLLAAACSDPSSKSQGASSQASNSQGGSPMVVAQLAPTPTAADLTSVQPAPDGDIRPDAPDPAIVQSASRLALPIDVADWKAEPVTPQAKKNALIRAEVLLARAKFSPGVIDGQDGDNLKNAIGAFENAHQLPVDGKMSPAVWTALSKDAQPALTDYTITADDVKGPFLAKVPTDMAEMAKLPAMSFTGPVQELAERFHMDEALLKSLNPNADFSVAGTQIVVAALGSDRLKVPVSRIEVDKTKRQVRAYGQADLLLAVYPATVGSTDRPAPDGEWAVRTVAPNPTYTYDPSRLTFGKASNGKLTIPPGPNNPVGSTWIDLTKDTYGIHGTPDPRMVGNAASHGCVRLTNWDARQLSQAVKKGTKVDFVGVEQDKPRKAAD
ncbi:L,D-transpeptidase [Phenylobacterium sp.]|uniref:L,D-transpeptidase family protein n=1 Tax=Phenylobacterium sp. TaxID=1871053 RepID=UPI002BDD01E8|nr:L,D-transpeptidase [Phenylobacterium sp.]HLZ75305.1 L,D-transpeptidase [Phenylobacterium sp.]